MSRTGRWGEMEGGLDTARLTAAEKDRIAREQRQADALAYLTRTGNTDVAEILGLVEPAPRVRAKRRRVKSKES